MKFYFKKEGVRMKTGLHRIKTGNNCALVNTVTDPQGM
jgi:hypothetical protein